MTMPKTQSFANLDDFIRTLYVEKSGLIPNRFPVMLMPKGDKVPVIGYVVTHLSIEDWCERNGFKLMELYPGTRPAHFSFGKCQEMTDLF